MKAIFEISKGGFVWHIDAHEIASHRADHYKDDGYEEEYEYAINDEGVLHEWFFGNMDWEDISDAGKKLIKTPTAKTPWDVEGYIETKLVQS